MKKRAVVAAAFVLGLAVLARFVPRPKHDGAPTPTTLDATATPTLKVFDLDGRVHGIGGVTSVRATALVFLATECPISNRYLPILNAIARARDSVAFYGVISDPTTTRAAAVEHVRRYGVEIPVLFDATGELAALYRPVATPEAFVLGPDGRVAYRGRIDDAFEAVGKPRQVVGHHDLEDALDAVVRGEPVAAPLTTPIGCVFEAWGKNDSVPPTITYSRDVAPILGAHCLDCHHDGGIAPFGLESFKQARKHAQMLADLTAARTMPPWHAAPGYGHFIGERRLSDREIATIGAWARAGAPEGDPKDLPPVPAFASSWQLGQPDLVVTMPRAFEVPASGPDIYRAFVLPVDLAKDEVVVAMEFHPGAPSVVHHCLVHLDNTGTGRKLEARAGGNGYPSFGTPGFTPSGALGGWVPGSTPRFLPHDLGRPFAKSSDVVIQVHYHPSGKVERDRSSIGLYFARKPVKKIVAALSLWTRDIDIPPGESRYPRVVDITLPVPITVVAITPHMHLIGREMKVAAKLPSGEVVPLAWVPDWDFRWQDQYFYRSPIELPAGTRIHLEALYDNSADNPNNPSNPPKRVKFGVETTDEMCLCFVAIAIDGPEDLDRILAAFARGAEPAKRN
jgi:hypothetical protein